MVYLSIILNHNFTFQLLAWLSTTGILVTKKPPGCCQNSDQLLILGIFYNYVSNLMKFVMLFLTAMLSLPVTELAMVGFCSHNEALIPHPFKRIIHLYVLLVFEPTTSIRIESRFSVFSSEGHGLSLSYCTITS